MFARCTRTRYRDETLAPAWAIVRPCKLQLHGANSRRRNRRDGGATRLPRSIIMLRKLICRSQPGVFCVVNGTGPRMEHSRKRSMWNAVAAQHESRSPLPSLASMFRPAPLATVASHSSSRALFPWKLKTDQRLARCELLFEDGCDWTDDNAACELPSCTVRRENCTTVVTTLQRIRLDP